MLLNDEKRRYLREEYISRINRVIDYINANIDRDLSLENLARIANFSKFHFHRIFCALAGETLNHYIQRIRIEKAASQLIVNPKKSITAIAFDCGFSGSASFARAFREAFQMSASEWRSGGYQQERKISKTDSNDRQTPDKIWKDLEVSSFYIEAITNAQTWRIKMKGKNQIVAEVQVKVLPELHVAYLRHIGPYKGDTQLFEKLFGKLMSWAGPRGLLRFPETKMLSIYHDSPEITAEEKLRTDVCITVPADTPVEGEIGKTTISGGKYAVGHFEIATDEYQAAWDTIFGSWMPESGFQPADGPSYELYLNNPKEHPEGKQIVEICVPVKPL